jgi:hypothetical protein
MLMAWVAAFIFEGKVIKKIYLNKKTSHCRLDLLEVLLGCGVSCGRWASGAILSH